MKKTVARNGRIKCTIQRSANHLRTDRQIDKQTDRSTDRSTNRQTDRSTDKQTTLIQNDTSRRDVRFGDQLEEQMTFASSLLALR